MVTEDVIIIIIIIISKFVKHHKVVASKALGMSGN